MTAAATETEERVIVTVSPRITLVTDFPDESYYVEVAPLVPTSEWELLDELLDRLGLEIMDEDECPSEALDSGWARLWCARIDGNP